MSIENAFEEIFGYYRSDPNIRAMFEGQILTIAVKFVDTKQIYRVNIHQDQTISLESNLSPKKPDIQVKIRSEQILLDLLNGDLPIGETFAKGKVVISKGFVKIARLYRKYVK